MAYELNDPQCAGGRGEETGPVVRCSKLDYRAEEDRLATGAWYARV